MKKIIYILLLVVGYWLGSSAQYQKDLYLGANAITWSNRYNDLFNVKCSDDVVEQYINDKMNQNGKKMSLDEFLICSVGINAYRNYLSKHPLSTTQNTLPEKTNTTIDNALPAWCDQVIQSWAASGYNRATINQLMKKDNPECVL